MGWKFWISTSWPVRKCILYNYCLHMRWTSTVINSRIVVLPEGFSPRGHNFWGLKTWCSPHMKAITCLLYRNYSKMFITWMFCFVEDNKIISGQKYNYGTGLKKTQIFNTLPVVGDFRLGDNLLSPSTLYILGSFTVLSPSSANFSKNIWIVFLLLYSKKICKV